MMMIWSLSAVFALCCCLCLFSGFSVLLLIFNNSNPNQQPTRLFNGFLMLRIFDQSAFDSIRKELITELERPIRRLPNAVIIGVKKAGTRALLEYLRLNPNIRAPGPEVHYFDRNYQKGLQWYRNQMPRTLSSQITIEKSPSYFITRNVPARIKSSMQLSDVKLIVVVRDPITRLLSDYTQTSSKRAMPPFEEMAFLNSSHHLIGSNQLHHCHVNTSWKPIKLGLYARQMRKWLKFFPLKQFHFVSGENLIQNPVEESKAVELFLGLTPLITAEHFYFNQTKGFPCLKKSPKFKEEPHCLGKTKGRTHSKTTASALACLTQFYQLHNWHFYRMVGRDFNWQTSL